MPDHLVARGDAGTIAITPLAAQDLPSWLGRQPARVARWVKGTGFEAQPGRHLMLPSEDGRPGGVLLGVEERPDIWSWGGLPLALPQGRYRVAPEVAPERATRAALGWGLGGYQFTRYRKAKRKPAELVWPDAADRAAVERAVAATFLVRDLVNTPAEDLGPAELAAASMKLARAHGAKARVIVGDALLRRNYPTIHAVGRASSRPPRLIDLRWGTRGPRITLVGKGVCFDSGGLDIKPASGMELMKKDMGGAAHVLALAQMIMQARLPVRLRVLVPAVENSVSGNAFRPLDVIRTRKGLTVEIGNTDAEGRLILCDALAEAATEKPDLIVDCATLTGSARVALGPELPAMFANDDATAEALLAHGVAEDDPVWRMPLHKGYRAMLDSKVADLNNVSSGSFAGAITAALFLQEFVAPGIPWVHLDLYAWNPQARPGRPAGGEAMALRALYALIAERAGAGTKGARGGKRAR
ncbi:MAG: leucyl aminopeptidase [Alphaproteobacteria bacterium]|nr:MAG: leucyl aminopeptidase [Alphaproteobacteria bacterium]